MHRLIVKGNKFEAAKAAARRGIPFVFDNELSGVVKGEVMTVGRTNADIGLLNSWFIEDMMGKNRAPYPIGSLLYWHPVGSWRGTVEEKRK